MDPEALSYPWHRLRSARYDQIYVSPHMDDAVYSCGGQIALERAAGKRILIVTVFGTGDDRPEAEGRGQGVFADYSVRKLEERAAAEALDVDFVWLNLPDLLVRPKPLGELVRYAFSFSALPASDLQAALYAALAALCTRLLASDGSVYFPLGVGGHPDHRIVHTVARAFVAHEPGSFWFYEDVPYAQVGALRNERLRALGLSRPDGVLAASRELQAFVFAHAPRWQRPLSLLMLCVHQLVSRALFGLLGPRRAVLTEHDLHERVIDTAIEQKVTAMRAYATQTAYFYRAGDALLEQLVRSEGHYVERYWRLAAEAAGSAIDRERHAPAARLRVEALLARTTEDASPRERP